MKLSKESAATMLQARGWVPLSSTAECFVSDTSPLVIKVLNGEVLLHEKEKETIGMEHQNFPCTADGIREAIRLAERARISVSLEG